MMANWNKLNEQFDNLLDSMSQEDWQSWADNREAKKVMRNYEMLLKAKLQEEKLLLSSSTGINIIFQIGLTSTNECNNVLFVTSNICSGNVTYAMAA
jgi:hypothetical protein